MLEAAKNNSSILNGGGGGGFSQLQSCFGDCSSEEELSVLPRHTKVIVTGNNRTKSVLVGLQGVVKKAVGLGGWHWLVLTNGIEVKLQRNALSVLEHPTGNEEDNDLEVDHTIQWNNPSDMTTEDTLKPHKSKQRGHRSSRLSQKALCRAVSCDSHSKNSSITPRMNMKVDLTKLDMAALLRYWRHFNLVDALPNPTKEQLIDIIQRHFMSQQMDELQVIVGFVQAATGMKKACQVENKKSQKH
ncbi:Histone deacetylase complex subunit SAP30 Sin3 binding domain [Arabidopsis suecica]|uniref:Histone deacetylase complex subunit SAP30 Sin3 binding domain n=1 Tax=Arabidopsis suecica TaxID=45249 RepID=A0A8T2BUJ7_ARASU|nr:Histone deacetylase complex subunit SAP30 Sin3 binding domain [Arabidopsis suecica]